MTENEISSSIIGAAIEVHKALGPGLLESTYHKCMIHKLEIRPAYIDPYISYMVKK